MIMETQRNDGHASPQSRRNGHFENGSEEPASQNMEPYADSYGLSWGDRSVFLIFPLGCSF